MTASRFDLSGRYTLVTGGAVGLGRAMGEALAEQGSAIAIMDLDGAAAEKAAEEISARLDVRAIGIRGDVTRPEDAEAVVRQVLDWSGGRLDCLINNAGIVKHVPAEDMSYADWSAVMNVNVNGVFLMSQSAGRAMIRQRKGSIINISSMSGLIVNTPQCQSAYNASKAAVIGLTKSLASEWAPHGIRVNAIAPGYMKTELTRPFFEGGGEMIDRWMSMTPMGRPGTPDELGGIAVYLASDASSFATGSVFTIDGGYTAW